VNAFAGAHAIFPRMALKLELELCEKKTDYRTKALTGIALS
jgi:hypothetical protein